MAVGGNTMKIAICDDDLVLNRKRSVEGMKTRSKATRTLRAMLARSIGFGASPNMQGAGLCGHGGIACHLAAALKMA